MTRTGLVDTGKMGLSHFAKVAFRDQMLDDACRQTKIESIVLGASLRTNIVRTKELISKLDSAYGRSVA